MCASSVLPARNEFRYFVALKALLYKRQKKRSVLGRGVDEKQKKGRTAELFRHLCNKAKTYPITHSTPLRGTHHLASCWRHHTGSPRVFFCSKIVTNDPSSSDAHRPKWMGVMEEWTECFTDGISEKKHIISSQHVGRLDVNVTQD